ncbi:MAG: PAS domain S-box protein [Actinomycetota bacterium]|nr:PAS domain S-box protein [Actinomycetota bacterium]
MSETEATSHAIVDSSASGVEALRESHELLALATEGAQAGWGTWDLRTGESNWDERGKQIMGFADDSEADTAEGWLDRIHPEDRPEVEAYVARCIAEDLDFGMDYRVIRADGQIRNIRATARFKKAEDGTALRATGLVMDVTERKRAEEALRESEERYRTLFESIDEGFCVVEVIFNADGEPVDYRFLETNPAFERHTGLHGATGKRMREIAPDHEAHWFEIYGHVASTGEPVRFVNEAKALDGRWFDVYAFRLGSQESRRVAILFNNITERKRDEEALRESEDRLRRAMEIETVGVIFFRTDGSITDANDAFLQMSGYNREDLAEGLVRWDEMTPPEWMPHSLKAIEEFKSTGRIPPYEKEYIRKEGSRWWALFAATSLGEEVGVEFIIDVTGRKRAEEERERLIAHELTARAQAEERQRLSRELHDRVAHNIALVHQSLELHEALKTSDPKKAAAKMQLARRIVKEALESTRNLSMELREPEVRRGLEAALANLLRDLVPPNIESSLSVEGDEAPVPPEIRSQLFLILREAIRNAVTHSGAAHIAVEVDTGQERVVGRVEDDGSGFDPDEIRTTGTGGLRAMSERATLVGATLDLSSVPGRGTTIQLSVPLGDA